MDEDGLEEGELSNDSEIAYTPLERPVDYSSNSAQPNSRFPSSTVVNNSSDSSEIELRSSESDSDSDNNLHKNNKKPKIKLKVKLNQQQDPKRKKYDIWSTRVQEDVLAETLNCCDVTKKDRSRDVETYDISNRLLLDRKTNKRSRDDRNNTNLRHVNRSRSSERNRGTSRVIKDVSVTLESSCAEIASDIANKLCEDKEDLILRIVDTLGKEKAFLIFKETKRIEEEGGMLIMNQTRRRTPGGVFLFLVRHDDDITEEQKSLIFEEEKQKSRAIIKEKQKKKLKKLKEEIAASKSKLLPDLLTRAELLANENKHKLKETDERDCINPPPTPETDGGHENSGDGMENLLNLNENRRKIEAYDEDFLDIGGSADMDLF